MKNQTFAILTFTLFLIPFSVEAQQNVVVQPNYTPWQLPFEPQSGVIYNSDGTVTTYVVPAPVWGWQPLPAVVPEPEVPLDTLPPIN